ncbi:hypothetical protein [Flavobacterium sp. JP2137]|uniref:hypothetical protein n=1 Tax=Flavobacterium sp. JP2137 TaxID=3414510 RepID=UPI003D2FBFBA
MKYMYMLFCFVFFSCDPEDNRLIIRNNTKDSICVRFRFPSEIDYNKEANERSGLREVLPLERISIGIFNRWEGEFERAKPDTLIYVLIMKKSEINSSLLTRNISSNSSEFDNLQYHIWDSLYIRKKYMYKGYSLKDLESLKWKINYPEDGFQYGCSSHGK